MQMIKSTALLPGGTSWKYNARIRVSLNNTVGIEKLIVEADFEIATSPPLRDSLIRSLFSPKQMAGANLWLGIED
jgi:hypothetical protein